MTVNQLVHRLGAHDGELPVLVRVQWTTAAIGETITSVFVPRFVISEMDPDVAIENVIIEADEEED